jgi:hypothetical protein
LLLKRERSIVATSFKADQRLRGTGSI